MSDSNINDFLDFVDKSLDEDFAKDYPWFRLRLFLSLDFTGSTNFKQSSNSSYSSSSVFTELNKDGEQKDRDENEARIMRHTAPWIPPFSYFFLQIDHLVKIHWAQLIKSYQVKLDDKDKENDSSNETDETSQKFNAKDIECTKFWKPIGDEIVYQVRLEHPIHVLLSIQLWLKLTKEIRKGIKGNGPLNVKASAWLAGFPINNSEFVTGPEPEYLSFMADSHNGYSLTHHHLLPLMYRLAERYVVPKKGDNKERLKAKIEVGQKLRHQKIDYLGPQIDLGFRVASKSTPRKMMISADLAYILSYLGSAKVSPDHQVVKDKSKTEVFCDDYYKEIIKSFSDKKTSNVKNHEKVMLYYDGQVELKGVRSGLPYPLFWLEADNDNVINQAEDKLKPVKKANLKDLLEFMDLFLKQNFKTQEETDKKLKITQQKIKTERFTGHEWLIPPFVNGYNMISGDAKVHLWHKQRRKVMNGSLIKLLESNIKYAKDAGTSSNDINTSKQSAAKKITSNIPNPE